MNGVLGSALRTLARSRPYQRFVQRVVFQHLIELNMSKWMAKPVYVVTRLGIPELLADGPRPLGELASLTSASPDALRRILLALTSFGVFTQTTQDVFALDHLGRQLNSDVLRTQVLRMQAEWHDKAWANLLHCVRTGHPSFERSFGTDLSTWLATNPDAAKDETDCHASRLAASYAALARACDFGEYGTVVDVGGGHGELLIQILRHNPGVRGVLAELPHMLDKAAERLGAVGLGERCERVATNFFKQVPPDADLYMLHQILHDWSDDECVALLRACRRAMHSSSKLMAVEMIIPEHDGLSMAKLLDLEMLVMGAGRERTEAELRRLFTSCEFEVVRVTPTRGDMAALEVVPV